MVNDQMTDDNRRLLTLLAPWLLGTSTADPRAWPAITGACIRAALAWASEPGKPRLKADLDTARNWLAEASRPPMGGGGHPGRAAGSGDGQGMPSARHC